MEAGEHHKGWRVRLAFDVSEALRGKSKKDENQTVKVDEEAVKLMSSKLMKPLFEVNVRIVASAPSQFQADSILDGLMAGFSQVAAPNRNEFKVTRVSNNDRDFSTIIPFGLLVRRRLWF